MQTIVEAIILSISWNIKINKYIIMRFLHKNNEIIPSRNEKPWTEPFTVPFMPAIVSNVSLTSLRTLGLYIICIRTRIHSPVCLTIIAAYIIFVCTLHFQISSFNVIMVSGWVHHTSQGTAPNKEHEEELLRLLIGRLIKCLPGELK